MIIVWCDKEYENNTLRKVLLEIKELSSRKLTYEVLQEEADLDDTEADVAVIKDNFIVGTVLYTKSEEINGAIVNLFGDNADWYFNGNNPGELTITIADYIRGL